MAVVLHRRQSGQVVVRVACSAGGIHMVEVAVPAAGLDAGQPGAPGGQGGEAPDTEKTVCAVLVDAGIGFRQREDFDPQAGQQGQGAVDVAQKLLALCSGQCVPRGIGVWSSTR